MYDFSLNQNFILNNNKYIRDPAKSRRELSCCSKLSNRKVATITAYHKLNFKWKSSELLITNEKPLITNGNR